MNLSKITLAVLLAMTSQAQAAQGPSSSVDSYLQAAANSGAQFTALLTTGDKVGGYMMGGIPDGLGAYDNGNGTFTVLMNHELGNTVGVARGPLSKGAYVSEWVIDKTTLAVVSGGDLIKNVYGWNSTTQTSNTVANTTTTFNRFCSADLAKPSAFFNATTGNGSTARIFLNGEEGGATGYALGTVATGADKGNTYVLGKFNQATNGSGVSNTGGWENLLANPFTGDKTVVIGNNDGGTGTMNNSVAVYVGTKTNTGSEVDKAGLTNGVTKFINVQGVTNEIANATTRATGIADGTRFSLNATASTTFSRPEDGTWSNDGKKFVFVTTDQIDNTENAGGTQNGGTRLWELTFDDITNPDAGGTIKKLFDSTTIANGSNNLRPNMFDNIGANEDGTYTILEDTGGANHNGKVWIYDPKDGSMKMLAKFDPTLFGDVVSGVYTAGTHTNDEETSGVIDITSILGRNDGKTYNLLVAQDHTAASKSVLGIPAADQVAAVEGGQLLVMAVPETDTYAMLLAGLGIMGVVARRRQK